MTVHVGDKLKNECYAPSCTPFYLPGHKEHVVIDKYKLPVVHKYAKLVISCTRCHNTRTIEEDEAHES